MQQVLFRIPITFFGWFPDGIPIYGFGAMLFVAFFTCIWLASRRAKKEGVPKEVISDLAFFLLLGGIIGARLSSILIEAIQNGNWGINLVWQFFRFWDGGLIFYGSAIGGLLGYALAYRFVIRKHNLSTWKLADIIAPSVAVGLCIGRIGCFLNGCCYGGVNVTCPQCVTEAAHFPLSSPPRFALVHEGYQTAAGFTLKASDEPEVGAVEPGTPAAASGLKAGDVLVALRDFPRTGETYPLKKFSDLEYAFSSEWRGRNSLAFTVKRGAAEIPLPAFAPRTLGLYPTQVYESISMLLLFFLLTAYLPFRRREGEVMAVLMFSYGIHRSLNEMLRDDARPVAFEKYISFFLIASGLALWIWLRRTPGPVQRSAAVPAAAS